jgi:hypothetical protein
MRDQRMPVDAFGDSSSFRKPPNLPHLRASASAAPKHPSQSPPTEIQEEALTREPARNSTSGNTAHPHEGISPNLSAS